MHTITLKFTLTTELTRHAGYRKAQSRLYFLKKIRSFNEYQNMFLIFYQSFVASAIFLVAKCWASGIRAYDQIKPIWKVSSTLTLEPLEEVVVEKRMLHKNGPLLHKNKRSFPLITYSFKLSR